MHGLRQVLSEAAEKPDAFRLPKLPQRGRKAYDLSNEGIESLLITEDAKGYGRSTGNSFNRLAYALLMSRAVCRQFGSNSAWLSVRRRSVWLMPISLDLP